MSGLPILGESRKPGPALPVALTAIAVGLLSGLASWWTHRPPAAAPVAVTAVPQATAPDTTPSAPAPTAQALQPAGDLATKELELKTVRVTIQGPLESALVAAVGKETGSPLAQVVARALVWWVRVPQDVLRGDTLSVVYEPRLGREPVVHAVRFTSGTLGRTVEAFRYQPTGAPFARLFLEDGSELEERLIDGPLDSYEQVTSRLRDGRRHKGVDFKTPIGTPVRAPFDGVVTRKNWNFSVNGNSLELLESGGARRTALFLHLSELPKSVQPGQRVRKGDVIASSGNSGRSFAPHLHYQLMQGDTVLDPFESHATVRVALPAPEKVAFDRAVSKLRARLSAETVTGAAR